MEEKLNILVYKGRLGHEQYMTTLDATNWPYMPCKGELISFGDELNNTDETYEVINVLTDVAKRDADDTNPYTINMFVQEYIWD